MKKIIVLFTVLIILCSIGVLSFYYFKIKIGTSKPQHHIDTLKITYNKPYTFIGRQEPAQRFPVHYEPHKGYINDWYVKSNDKIAKNQPLFEYYNPRIEHQISNKQKHLAQLKQNNKSPTTPIHSEILHLQNQISQLQEQLRITVYAPAPGIVHITKSWPNQTKSPVMQIYDPTTIIKAEIDEAIIDKLHLKDKVSIKDNNQQTFDGEVKYISNFPIDIDRSTKHSKYLIEINSNSTAVFGKHFKVEIPNHIIEIPKTAIHDKQFVFVQRNKKFIKRVIKTQNSGNNKDMLILEGLNQGDVIAKNADTVLSKN
ncbi:efflux RND transporter periplasmic adaptor subunit [Staphylococcus equorum]|uniref:Efflux RND transporter periplasmic adaptor subunit n=1 Tax=Staphylococcus equorum TaxID=246432 RepID=A0A9X4R1U0_9STAP|nr:efflux RND transporter periplasmic adaptor subunit [Staphylococcus equorum]MDG0859530.1 efflux RND transporter periplasmic adaptor subunit [Staphylococcus equorum]